MQNSLYTPVRLVVMHFCLLLSACSDAAMEEGVANASLTYHTHFEAVFDSASSLATVTIDLKQTHAVARELNFNAPADNYQVVAADGQTDVTARRIRWLPPASGGRLTYTFQINQGGTATPTQAHTSNWTVLRLDRLFPSARVRALKDATNSSSLMLLGPEGWSFESAYGPLTERVRLPTGDRIFNRPAGWLVGGDLGTRRSTIAGVKVAVSAPKGSGVRRMDTLVFLRWVLPPLKALLPKFPERLLIVGAPEEMWRGGISAPNSLYMHSGRPLVSENGTSTLLHELVHVAGVHSAAPGADWLVEGLAEYVGIVVLQQSGGASTDRTLRTLATLKAWVDEQDGSLADPSKGVDTAAAVLLLHTLDQELTSANSSLGELLSALITSEEFSLSNLHDATHRLLGRPSQVLAPLLAAHSGAGKPIGE